MGSQPTIKKYDDTKFNREKLKLQQEINEQAYDIKDKAIQQSDIALKDLNRGLGLLTNFYGTLTEQKKDLYNFYNDAITGTYGREDVGVRGSFDGVLKDISAKPYTVAQLRDTGVKGAALLTDYLTKLSNMGDK